VYFDVTLICCFVFCYVSHEFFKDAGAVADIRIAQDETGRSRGFGHVEFETADGAKKALEKSGQSVLDREIFCDLARERGAATPASGGKDWSTTYVLQELSHLFDIILWFFFHVYLILLSSLVI
jgi:RNA recognition motif-containing protein